MILFGYAARLCLDVFAYVYIGDFTFKISECVFGYLLYTAYALNVFWDSVVMYPSLDIQNMI